MRNWTILLLICWSTAFPLHGQTLSKPFVIQYSKELYGAANQNWSVSADRDGYVFAGNDQGLLEFDGSNWILHLMPDHGVVRSVLAGNDGRIYVGSFEEFGYWERHPDGQLTYHSLSDLLPPGEALHNDEIWRIVYHEGSYLFQSFAGLVVYDGQDLSMIRPPVSMVLLMKARNRLFVHMVGQGLCEFTGKEFRLIPGSEIFGANEIKLMLPFGDRDFLVGVTGVGLFVWNGDSFVAADPATNEALKPWQFNNGLSTSELLVIGTIGSGVYLLHPDGRLANHLHTGNFLQNNTVLGLGLDQDGKVWAALDRGIDLIHPDPGLDFYIDPTYSLGSVYAAAPLGGDLLVGTNQGLYRYHRDARLGFTQPVRIAELSGQIWDLKAIGNGVFCGHTDGSAWIVGDELIPVSDINGGFSIQPYPFSGEGWWLQSTYSALVFYRMTGDRMSFSHVVDGFYEPISSFGFDHRGYFWGAHATKGLFRIRISDDLKKIDEVHYFGREEGLVKDNRLNVAVVENQMIILSGDSIFAWDDIRDEMVPYTWLNHRVAPFHRSHRVIPSGNHRYWFMMDNEIARFRITGDEVVCEYRYDLSMQSLYLNNRFARIAPIDGGQELICLDNGFAIYDPEKHQPRSDPHPVRVTAFTATSDRGRICRLDCRVDQRRVPRIPFSCRNISVFFSAGTGLKRPLYRWRIDELNPQWSAWSQVAHIQATRLPKGEYRLEMEAKDINGRDPAALTYPFVVRPPWYGSVAALMVYALAVLMALVLLRILFLKRLKLHKEKIEEKELIRRQQEILINEQEMIRLKNENLQAELRFKNTQLADYTMGIIKRNEQLLRIKKELIRTENQPDEKVALKSKERILRMIERQISSEDEWSQFETHFEQTHQDFLKRLKTAFPQLTQSDLKLCAYMRLNISSKQIAQLLNISIRGVEVRRYRLRKRLQLPTEENLYEFLLKY